MTNLNAKHEIISDEALDTVAGGLNPQPLPPRWTSMFSFQKFAINFAIPSFSLFKFR